MRGKNVYLTPVDSAGGSGIEYCEKLKQFLAMDIEYQSLTDLLALGGGESGLTIAAAPPDGENPIGMFYTLTIDDCEVRTVFGKSGVRRAQKIPLVCDIESLIGELCPEAFD